MQFESKYKERFSFNEINWKCRLQNGGAYVSDSVCYAYLSVYHIVKSKINFAGYRDRSLSSLWTTHNNDNKTYCILSVERAPI